ncbi:hypothetical protein C8J56DRAFT_1043138 [Mycena floridula]|nr:hypothetical protein C8J56DRAFT_1043138 [Mycena floridula]
MRSMTGLPLDDDIIDRILFFAPTFADLKACILVSKSFYNVFDAHPNSIVRAVAYNIAGPALRQAMRTARYQLANDNESADKTLPEDRDEISPIKTDEIRTIVEYAKTASDLEAIFSIRYKDRTSQTSKLSPMESWRFRRAIYRLMMYAQVFHLGSFISALHAGDSDDDGDTDDKDGQFAKMLKAERQKRKDFLYDFPTDELRELHTVSVFLMELADWAATACHQNDNDYPEGALAVGPLYVLESYQTKHFESILVYFEDDDIDADSDDSRIEIYLEGYLSLPITQIMEARKVPASWTTDHWKSILEDNTITNTATGAQCAKPDGLKLFGEPNWHYLYGATPLLRVHSLPDLLKGQLKSSFTTTNYLRNLDNQYSGPGIPDFYPTMMKELFDVKLPAYASWNMHDWLCTDCIQRFISDNLHLWLLERQRKDGVAINDDCWYGYNCRTQTHNQTHAQKLNHLCQPTRGA